MNVKPLFKPQDLEKPGTERRVLDTLANFSKAFQKTTNGTVMGFEPCKVYEELPQFKLTSGEGEFSTDFEKVIWKKSRILFSTNLIS